MTHGVSLVLSLCCARGALSQRTALDETQPHTRAHTQTSVQIEKTRPARGSPIDPDGVLLAVARGFMCQ